MARVSAYTVHVGEPQTLEVAQGEDREFRLTFIEPENAGSTGPVDFSDVSELKMHIRGAGISADLFGSFVASGMASWPLPAAATTGVAQQVADVDAVKVTIDGYRSQILVASRLIITQGL